MRTALEVFRFELAYQLRRASTLFYFVLLLAICSPFMQMMANGPHQQGMYLNAPFAVTVMVVFGSMLALLIVAAFAGDAATRDVEVRMHSLFYTSAISKRAYVLGRFLGAFSLSALLLFALPLGAVIAAWPPWIGAERLAPLRAAAHLTPYFLFALPNAFIATAVAFSLATMTRRAIASYAGAAFLFFSALVCAKLLAPRLGWSTAKLLDPLGFTTVQALWQSTTSLQKNTYVLAADSALLANRLLWLSAGLVLLTIAYARFRFTHVGVARDRARTEENDLEGRVDTPTFAMPAGRRVFDAPTRRRQLLAIAARSFLDLHASRVWWIVPLLALLFIQAAPELATLEMGLQGSLTTARLFGFLTDDVSILLTLLVALSAGELVWREREARMHPLAGVAPVPDWMPVTGKFLGLAMMLVATHLIFLFAGLAVQAIFGTERYELGLSLRILFGLQLPEYLLAAALAMFVHVLVNQKYVANVLIALTPIARGYGRRAGIDDLLLYGDLPRWSYSEMAGFGPRIEARLWFTLYFAGCALLLALMTYLFWRRGERDGVRQRIALARRRVSRNVAIVGGAALATVAGAGGFIFSNTHGVNAQPGAAQREQRRADYERRYGRYASLPQPALTAATLHVDFHPRRRVATIRGSYRLENRSRARIDAIHVATAPGLATKTSVSFDRASRITVDDRRLDYRIHALGRALEPGEAMRMDFVVVIETSVFADYVTPPVVRNGSVIIHRPGRDDHWLPLVGYQFARELNDAALRRKYGLRDRAPHPRLGDIPVGNEQKGYELLALETIVGTDEDQVGVAPGSMRRTWTENGRRYVHYVTEAPISDAWTITSARYAVRRAKWRDVAIEIFHDPAHTANVDRMMRAAQAALESNTRQFGPYRFRQLRLVEYPSDPYRLQMTAHASLITYAEGFSLVRTAEESWKIDFPFAVVTHEVGHQWWGHQLTPARVEGAALLTESLAWYSGMLVVEETFGREHLRRIVDLMRAQYLQPHQPRTVPLLRAVDQLDAYRTGPFAMYALRRAVGVEVVNRALRNLLAKFPPGRAPYPTTLDFYAELRAATPAPMHGLLKDLFEEITFWDLRAKRLEGKATPDGTHRVVLTIEAQKLKGDAAGNERPVPMDDPIEIAVYDAAGNPIHRAMHRIQAGVQTIEMMVARPPARAEIDPDHQWLDRNVEDNAVMAAATR